MQARATLTVLALTLATGATGGIEHTVLHGVSVGTVRAWIGPDSIPGVTQEQLQGRVESLVREAGVRVDPTSTAQLWVGANVFIGPVDGRCFVVLEAKLNEEARLERNDFLVRASSWSRGATIVMDQSDQCAGAVKENAESLVADFVEHYTAMNPNEEP